MGLRATGRFGFGLLAALAVLGAWAAPALGTAPSVSKSFGATSIPLNGSTSLTISIFNPNGTALSPSFTDSLPAGLVVATPNGLSNDCGGTVSAVAGSSSVSLSAGAVPGGSLCLVSVNVTGTWAGEKDNSVMVTSSAGSATGMASVTVMPPPTADRVYWAGAGLGQISYADLDGSGGGDLTGLTTKPFPTSVALDPAAGRIYWAHSTNISYANLDGSGGATDLATGVATVNTPVGLAIDPAVGKIYWANVGGNKISWAKLDGSGVGGDLPTGIATVNSPSGVAPDPAAGKIYWANSGGNKISWAKLDGSGVGGDLPTGIATVNTPDGVAIDPTAGRIYWANGNVDKISFARLDGSDVGGDVSTGTAPLSGPEGVAIDPGTNRIYWGNVNAKKISFATLDATAFGGLDTLYFSNEFPVLLRAPSAAGAPTVSGGATPGSVLSCSTGTWAPDLVGSSLYRAPRTFAYQWRLNGADIDGATSSTYAAASTGSYSCSVTASNVAGSGGPESSTAFSVQLAPPGATAATGQRAAAIKKCKKKFRKGPRRKKCIKKAKRLPL